MRLCAMSRQRKIEVMSNEITANSLRENPEPTRIQMVLIIARNTRNGCKWVLISIIVY